VLRAIDRLQSGIFPHAGLQRRYYCDVRITQALLCVFATSLASCGVTQSQGPYLRLDATGNTTDSAVNDAGTDAAVDAKVCSNGRVIFLNFEGVGLSLAATSDALANRINWFNNNVTIPRFRANDANRATMISDITRLARANLAQFPVTIVTTRPATGPYIMVTFGGARSLFNTTFPAVTGLNCGDTTKSSVGWIADDVTAQQGANLVVSVAAIGVGLTGITESQPRDCLCGWGGAVCTPDQTQACVLSTAVLRDQRCPNEAASQNEVASFNKAFCEMR
jgi:hypothetical protein